MGCDEKLRIAAEVGFLVATVAAGDVGVRSVLDSVANVIRSRMPQMSGKYFSVIFGSSNS